MGDLILTARFEADVQSFLQAQRERYFPLERNVVPAHLTLFHALSDDAGEVIGRHAPGYAMPASIADVRLFGRGGGYIVASAELDALRARLRAVFLPVLSDQDRQPWRAHVTFQNKVEKAQARRDYAQVLDEFAPMRSHIVALDLWRYLDGPWALKRTFELSRRLADRTA